MTDKDLDIEKAFAKLRTSDRYTENNIQYLEAEKAELLTALKLARDWMLNGVEPLMQSRAAFYDDLKTVEAAIAKAEGKQ